MKKVRFLVLFMFFALSHKASAQSQMQMNEEAYADYEKADKQLNVVYNQFLKLATEEEKNRLIKSQKDWIKARENHCDLEAAEAGGGSMQPLIYANCMEEETKKRINYLKATYNKNKQIGNISKNNIPNEYQEELSDEYKDSDFQGAEEVKFNIPAPPVYSYKITAPKATIKPPSKKSPPIKKSPITKKS